MASFVQRQYRLGANRQFSYVYRRGKRVSTKDLSASLCFGPAESGWAFR